MCKWLNTVQTHLFKGQLYLKFLHFNIQFLTVFHSIVNNCVFQYNIILLCLKDSFILSKICCFQSIAIGWFVWEGFVSLEGLLSMWWNYSSKLEHKRVESSKLGCEIRLAGIWDWLILLYSDWYHMWIGAGERKKWFLVSFKGQWVKTKSKPMVISLTKTTLHYLCCNP